MLVAATGMSRSTPGASQTTQTRPSRCLLVIPRQGRVSPYRGCAGSVTSICSAGGTVSPIGVVFWVGFPRARATDGDHVDRLLHEASRPQPLQLLAQDRPQPLELERAEGLV